AVLAAIAAGAALELFRIARHRNVRPFTLFGAAIAALLVLLGVLVDRPERPAGRLLLAAMLFTAAFAVFPRCGGGSPLAAAALTGLGARFAGGTLLYGVLLRDMPVPASSAGGSAWVGPALLAFPLALTWLSDTFAYFGGRSFGRHKLIPAVSPGKTVEG